MRALVLALVLALAGCSVTRYPGHEHDGEQVHLECEACAQAVQGLVLRTLRQATQPRASVAPVGS